MINKLWLKKIFNKYHLVIACLFFALIIVLIYWPSIKASFILDDYIWIQPLAWKQIGHLFIGSWEHGNTLRPIMRLEFFANYLLFGQTPAGWHLMNITLHVIITTILYYLTLRFTNRKKIALCASIIFALFPTNHEVVAWASGQTHSFSLLISFVAYYFLFGGLQKKANKKLIAGFFFLLLAFLTYELSFALPFVLLAVILFIGPRTKRSYFVAGGASLMLFLLAIYRYFILGRSLGEVSLHHAEILLAPFINLPRLVNIYFYSSRKLMLLFVLIVLVFLYYLIKNKVWKSNAQKLKISLMFLVISILTYLPFSIVKGVASRFIYSSLFFLLLSLAVLYSAIRSRIDKFGHLIIIILVFTTISLSAVQTKEVALRYRQTGDAYDNIIAVLKNHSETWPVGRNILFYGLLDSNKNILAFLTYFEVFVRLNYPPISGDVYRNDRLTKTELEWVLSTNPIIYRFIDFEKGIIKEQD